VCCRSLAFYDDTPQEGVSACVRPLSSSSYVVACCPSSTENFRTWHKQYLTAPAVARRFLYVVQEKLEGTRVQDRKCGITPLIDGAFVYQTFVQQRFKCVYCLKLIRARGPHALEIDRKRTDQAHTSFNSVLCCLSCRSLKEEDYSFEEFTIFRVKRRNFKIKQPKRGNRRFIPVLKGVPKINKFL